MCEDKLGALVPEMDFQATRLSLAADTFGARAPVLPRVILPACFDPSTRRVWIANVMWRGEGPFITYDKALINSLRP